MKIFLSRFFLFIFILQNAVVGELLKLPLLVQHYEQHITLHHNTTIYGFLKMHYIDPTVMDEDYAQDMQLPFKAIDLHSYIIQLSLPPLIETKVASVYPQIKDEAIQNFKVKHLLYYHDSIFRPPKLDFKS